MTLNDLMSPMWWGTAVAGSIVLKVVADYIRRGIDSLLSKVVSAWDGRSKKSQAQFRRNVDRLKVDADYADFVFKAEVRYRLMANQLLIMAALPLMFLIFINIISGFGALHAISPGGNGFWGWGENSKFGYITSQISCLGSFVVITFMAITTTMKSSSLANEQLTAREEIRKEKSK
ncbi:hypothetical protein [Burkholderia gladioli]|uniref:hypothetical protein n=1 Tax=Burkholderia gladioli TaxID=28095 RepID=UPI0016409BDE|nr:hypothetical protein [Burkholderia gladioli]